MDGWVSTSKQITRVFCPVLFVLDGLNINRRTHGLRGRKVVKNILKGIDDRLRVVLG